MQKTATKITPIEQEITVFLKQLHIAKALLLGTTSYRSVKRILKNVFFHDLVQNGLYNQTQQNR